jgi:hypothetical protein
MKKQPRPQPTRSKLSIFRQLCNLIPPHLVSQLARDTRHPSKRNTSVERGFTRGLAGSRLNQNATQNGHLASYWP